MQGSSPGHVMSSVFGTGLRRQVPPRAMPAPPGLGGGFEASGRWARGCRAGKKQTESVRRRAHPPLVEGPTPAEHVAFAASVVGQAGAALGFSAIEVSCMIGGISGWLSTSPGGWCSGPTWTTLDRGQSEMQCAAQAVYAERCVEEQQHGREEQCATWLPVTAPTAGSRAATAAAERDENGAAGRTVLGQRRLPSEAP